MFCRDNIMHLLPRVVLQNAEEDRRCKEDIFSQSPTTWNGTDRKVHPKLIIFLASKSFSGSSVWRDNQADYVWHLMKLSSLVSITCITWIDSLSKSQSILNSSDLAHAIIRGVNSYHKLVALCMNPCASSSLPLASAGHPTHRCW